MDVTLQIKLIAGEILTVAAELDDQRMTPETAEKLATALATGRGKRFEVPTIVALEGVDEEDAIGWSAAMIDAGNPAGAADILSASVRAGQPFPVGNQVR